MRKTPPPQRVHAYIVNECLDLEQKERKGETERENGRKFVKALIRRNPGHENYNSAPYT